MSTVNGRTLKEVLTDLQRYVEPPHKTRDGYGYFKAAEYITKFDEVVGVAGYNVEYSDYQYQITSAGQECFTVKCIITILDDDSRPVIKREAYGSCECKYSKDTGKVVNLQNSSDFVCSYAFKNAAKRFGIFGLKTKDLEGEYTQKQTPKPKQNQTATTDKKELTLNFYTKGSFEQVSERDGRPVYKLSAYEAVGDGKCRDTISQIIWYPNQYSKVAGKLNEIIATCEKRAMGLRIKVKSCGDDKGINQYVFLGFDAA